MPWHGNLLNPVYMNNALQFRLLIEEAFIPERSIDDNLMSSLRSKQKAGMLGSNNSSIVYIAILGNI